MREIKSQGDLTFIPVEYFNKNYIDKFTQPKGNKVIAEGESTGHFHAIDEGEAEIFIPENIKGIVNEMLIKAKERALIEHQEHEAFEIYGDYIAVIQQEVDHFEKTLKRVVD